MKLKKVQNSKKTAKTNKPKMISTKTLKGDKLGDLDGGDTVESPPAVR